MRSVVTLHAIAVFAQPLLAGQILAGDFDIVAIHGGVANLITLLALGQIVAAILLWRPGRGPVWPIWASVGLLLAEVLQEGFGYAGLRAAHVPLGTAVVAAMALFLVWVWRVRRHAAVTP
jgi:hypothetical protein